MDISKNPFLSCKEEKAPDLPIEARKIGRLEDFDSAELQQRLPEMREELVEKAQALGLEMDDVRKTSSGRLKRKYGPEGEQLRLEADILAIVEKMEVLGFHEGLSFQDVLDLLWMFYSAELHVREQLDEDREEEEGREEQVEELHRFFDLMQKRVHHFDPIKFFLSPENVLTLFQMGVLKKNDLEKLEGLVQYFEIDFSPLATQDTFSALFDGRKGLMMFFEQGIFDELISSAIRANYGELEGAGAGEMRLETIDLIDFALVNVLKQFEMENSFEGAHVAVLESVFAEVFAQRKYGYEDQRFVRAVELVVLRIYKCVKNTHKSFY